MPRIEPGLAGREARTLPLCYADPPFKQPFRLYRIAATNRPTFHRLVRPAALADKAVQRGRILPGHLGL